MKIIFIFLAFVYFVSPISASKLTQAEQYEGRVVGVSDGDTITVLSAGNKQLKIRLSDIDTPESAQPYGNRSKQKLSDLVFNETVTIKVRDTDRYGRLIGRVYVKGIDVNAMMVEIGAAWVYRQYSTDQNLFALEDKAKEYKIGLWGLPESERVPPWEWRKFKRQNTSVNKKDFSKVKEQLALSSGFTCGNKRTCGQMSSCEEAMFYLKQCGLNRLDRDRDGIPCESICR